MRFEARLLVAALLLLLGSDANGRARIPVHKHHSSHPSIGAATHSALLVGTTIVPNSKEAATAPSQLLASEATLHDSRVQSTPAPTRDCVSLCPHERTTSQAARPPPFQS